MVGCAGPRGNSAHLYMRSLDTTGRRHGLHIMLLAVPQINVASGGVCGGRNRELCALIRKVFGKCDLRLAGIDRAVIMTADNLNKVLNIIE